MHQSSYKDKLVKLNTDLPNKITQAFSKKPNVANAFVGERKILQGKRGRRSALFPSNKCGGTISVESSYEQAYAILLEQDEQVINYRTQAVKIFIAENQYAVPDFLIKNADGGYEIHEIKPNIKFISKINLYRFERLRDILKQYDIFFKIVDSTSLPNRYELQNLIALYQRAYFYRFSEYEKDFALQILQTTRFRNIEDIYDIFNSNNIIENLADYLVFNKKLSIIFE